MVLQLQQQEGAAGVLPVLQLPFDTKVHTQGSPPLTFKKKWQAIPKA